MKKVIVIALEKDADSAVAGLRRLGVLHVEHSQKPQGEDIAMLQADIELVNSVLEVISAKAFYCESTARLDKKLTDWRFTARHIVDMRKRLEQLEEYSATLAGRISQLEHWGDFDPKAIEELSKKNIFIRLYQIPSKEMHLVPEGVVVKKLFSSGGIVNCATASIGRAEIPFKEAPLPKTGLGKLRERLAEDKRTTQAIRDEVAGLACYHKDFLAIKKSFCQQLEFHQAVKGMARSAGVAYLTGYAPHDKAEDVILQAKKDKWGIVVRDPSEEDEVPTLIRAPHWASFIRPLFKLLEVIPGYRELDVSALFLVFFSIFFGIIIGDAGYGLVYLALTAFVHRKIGGRVADKRPFFLFYILSSCAIVWGVLTGTFFGQEWLGKIGIKPLVSAIGDIKFFQAFCFFLGAFHLTLAHLWRAILKFPALGFLSDCGWICLLWAAFLLAKTLILGDIFPVFGKWLVITGIGFVILFTNPQKNILKAVLEGLGALALSLVNSFTDVVSYIRLFAVGLAGLAIADTVNMLAADAGGSIVAAALIVLVGHTVNIVLGPMSVLVHGVRLNVLEFSGHAGVTWSGTAYKPLREEENGERG